MPAFTANEPVRRVAASLGVLGSLALAFHYILLPALTVPAPAMYGFFAGVGFEYSGFNLDYALLPYGDLGSAHRFSLGVRF